MKNVFVLKSGLYALALIGLLFTAACKKEKEDIKPDPTAMLAGKWQLKALTVDPPIDWFGAPVRNVYAQLPACVKDDITIFNANGTVNFDEGASKCQPNDPQTLTGTWAFSADKTKVSITQNGETETWDIVELKADIAIVDYVVTEDAITYTFSATYVKQP
jgi:hypothetical protein